MKIGSWNGIQLKENKRKHMTLLKTYQHHAHNYIFKFIYGSGYLYATCVLGSTNSLLLGYIKVPKGYKHEAIKII